MCKDCIGMLNQTGQCYCDNVDPDGTNPLNPKNMPEEKPEIGPGNAMFDMQQVDIALKHADTHGLRLELITYALYAMKADPTLSVGQALNEAMMEWDM